MLGVNTFYVNKDIIGNLGLNIGKRVYNAWYIHTQRKWRVMPTSKSWYLAVAISISAVIMISGCSLEQEQSNFQLQRLDSHNTPVMEEVYSDSVIQDVYSTDEISLP